MPYLQFILRNRRFLAFGVLMTMASSFGQTYFVALFGADIRAEFGLGHGDFGLVYSVATVVSAGCLIWVGRLIDAMTLRRYAVLVCLGLTGATFALAFADTLALLFLALFALRLTGQGLMTHTAITGMVRGFSAARGKAVSIANLGMPLAEGTFPIIAVAAMASLGWRHAWVLFGFSLALALVPTIHWLLRADRPAESPVDHVSPVHQHSDRRWTRRDVLRDPRFYLLLPAALASSFIITGLFFHQVHLAESKGWSLAVLAAAFVGFSIAQSLTGLVTGPAIDRIGATRLMPYALLPLGCGLLFLTLSDHPAIAFAYMVAAGIGAGISSTTVAAMWAEVYGVAHLGAIRALTTSLGVLASALSPFLFGRMIDLGLSIDRLALMNLSYVILASMLVPLAFRRPVAARPV